MIAKTMLALSASLSIAAAPPPPPSVPLQLCVEPREAEDLVVFLLPVLIDSAAAVCGATLAPGSPLARGGLATRYRAEAESAWPGAKRAFGRISGDKLGGLLGDDTLRKVVGEAVGKSLGSEIKPEACDSIDRIAAALAPLPARNVAQAVIALVDVSGKGDRSPLKICRTAPRR